MNLEAAFLEAAAPTPVVLLHQQLEPYSLGHEIMLQRFRSPFVLDPEREEGLPDPRIPQVQDLFLAVAICCQHFDEVRAFFTSNQIDSQISKWAKQCGQFDPAPIMVELQEYIVKGSDIPPFRLIKNRQRSRRGGAPWIAIIFYTLTRWLHFSRTEALNCPYGLAQWLYCIHWERDGGLQLVTQEDEDTEAAINAEFKKRGWERLRIDPKAN
jgi:hypothetical protein